MRARIGFSAAALLLLLLIAPVASGARSFRPRIGGAMGIVPPAASQDIAIGSNLPVVYHGGAVMSGPVRIHTVFWAPSGYAFEGSPGPGILGYEPMIQRFLADAAHDSGAASNVFSVLGQYPDLGGPGRYQLAYSPATDSIDDSAAYPSRARQCASTSGVATCVTDAEVAGELNRLIRTDDPSGRGLHDLWLMLLPPNVDECISPGSCGTNDYAGYHSLFNLGGGVVIYAVIIDPLIEAIPAPGSDPQGNPSAESSIDTVAHETVEGITNPEGVGWMDPNGYEIADECENDPQVGTPLGYADDGSPFDQVINGRRYLIQTMWSNSDRGCVQRSASTASPLPLASISIKQFSRAISGNTGRAAAGTGVRVALVRAGSVVARATARTRPGGSWGPVKLQSVSADSAHGFGDDRDQVIVSYSRGGPRPDLIETGNGGDPFSESGWTGWLELDTGYRVAHHSIQLAPCSQTGVLALHVGGASTAPPVTLCSTETGTATMATSAVGLGTSLSMSSSDNRAVGPGNPNGALVKLTVGLGELGSISAQGNAQVSFNPSGFPSCTADLRAQSVRCTGLVPDARYSLRRRRGNAMQRVKADGQGAILAADLPGAPAIARGDVLALVNARRRTLTTLHVAHLRVDINGNQTALASGVCEPGDYYGQPLTSPPFSAAVGEPGASGTGRICPLSGRAAGLPDAHVAQTDDLSGGQTRTEVPMLVGTAPTQDATLYGSFTALAQTGLIGANGSTYAKGAPVALTITRTGSTHPVRRAVNVDTSRGTAVHGLAPGVYQAKWVLSDANGDTRTVLTKFVEAG